MRPTTAIVAVEIRPADTDTEEEAFSLADRIQQHGKMIGVCIAVWFIGLLIGLWFAMMYDPTQA